MDYICICRWALTLQLVHHPHHFHAGESSCDLYILVRGDLHVLKDDRQTYLFRIPEGTIFGENSVVRSMEVRHRGNGATLVLANPRWICNLLVLGML